MVSMLWQMGTGYHGHREALVTVMGHRGQLMLNHNHKWDSISLYLFRQRGQHVWGLEDSRLGEVQVVLKWLEEKHRWKISAREDVRVQRLLIPSLSGFFLRAIFHRFAQKDHSGDKGNTRLGKRRTLEKHKKIEELSKEQGKKYIYIYKSNSPAVKAWIGNNLKAFQRWSVIDVQEQNFLLGPHGADPSLQRRILQRELENRTLLHYDTFKTD